MRDKADDLIAFDVESKEIEMSESFCKRFFCLDSSQLIDLFASINANLLKIK